MFYAPEGMLTNVVCVVAARWRHGRAMVVASVHSIQFLCNWSPFSLIAKIQKVLNKLSTLSLLTKSVVIAN